MAEAVDHLIRSVTSSYQLESFKELSESLCNNLKTYLHSTLSYLGNVNRAVSSKESNRSPVLSLELDSLVSGQLFALQSSLLGLMQSAFQAFETQLAAVVQKSFCLQANDVKEVSLVQMAHHIGKIRQMTTRVTNKVSYGTLKSFVADVPSKVMINKDFRKIGSTTGVERESLDQCFSNNFKLGKYLVVQAVNTRIPGGLLAVEPIRSEEPLPLTPLSKSPDQEFIVMSSTEFCYFNLHTFEQYKITLPDGELTITG
jgi:hypothetical protein